MGSFASCSWGGWVKYRVVKGKNWALLGREFSGGEVWRDIIK
ncbi:hypothetical protein Tco_1520748, partial [Tanacetum coccineum]